MLLNLTDLSDESLQNQISRQIRAAILAGDMPPGEPLASIRAMARENRVSVITVQRAYEALEREELIHSRRGKGFFVSALEEDARRNVAAERLQERLAPVISGALSEGLSKEDVISSVNQILQSSENAE